MKDIFLSILVFDASLTSPWSVSSSKARRMKRQFQVSVISKKLNESLNFSRSSLYFLLLHWRMTMGVLCSARCIFHEV